MAKAAAKTVPTQKDVKDYISQITPVSRREDCAALHTLMRSITGETAELWNGGIIGYGRYDYTYDSGHSGTFMRMGFANRKASLSVYVIDGLANHQAALEQLGAHKTGRSCLYIKRLADIDIVVLEEILRASKATMDQRYPPG